MKAEEVLMLMADALLEYLEELKDSKAVDADGFAYGQRMAYTECLEMMQQYDDAKALGLNFNIENKYPL